LSARNICDFFITLFDGGAMALTQWEIDARRLLKGQLALKGVGNKQLADKLLSVGVEITPGGLANKISRGTFSMVFFLQCCHVLGMENLSLNLRTLENKLPVNRE
jgi:hypothetical protein